LACKKPVLAIGDFNVAHLDEDIWNLKISKEVHKQAGLTPEERASFGQTLEALDLVDTHRLTIGEKSLGHFTYWSQRAKNKPLNRGLRLDYCLMSSGLKPKLVETVAMPDFTAQWGDHCPVGIKMKL